MHEEPYDFAGFGEARAHGLDLRFLAATISCYKANAKLQRTNCVQDYMTVGIPLSVAHVEMIRSANARIGTICKLIGLRFALLCAQHGSLGVWFHCTGRLLEISHGSTLLLRKIEFRDCRALMRFLAVRFLEELRRTDLKYCFLQETRTKAPCARMLPGGSDQLEATQS